MARRIADGSLIGSVRAGSAESVAPCLERPILALSSKPGQSAISAAENGQLSNTQSYCRLSRGHIDLELAGRQLAAPQELEHAPDANLEIVRTGSFTSARHRISLWRK